MSSFNWLGLVVDLPPPAFTGLLPNNHSAAIEKFWLQI
jgi:hypothetical protein